MAGAEADKTFLLSVAEMCATFARADAGLDDDTKRTHPVTPLDLIERQHPDQWVAVAITEAVSPTEMSGRLFASASNREMLQKKLQDLKSEHPELKCSVYFTGEYDFARDKVVG